jgi:hypothetical protein
MRGRLFLDAACDLARTPPVEAVMPRWAPAGWCLWWRIKESRLRFAVPLWTRPKKVNKKDAKGIVLLVTLPCHTSQIAIFGLVWLIGEL